MNNPFQKVSASSFCPKCNSSNTVKNGFTKNSTQQFFCKECAKRYISYYKNNACKPSINRAIILLTKEGMGIRSTARVLKISATTLLKRIIQIANTIEKPIIKLGKTYEVDEMRTFIKRKSRLIWVVYALERETRKVVCFNTGSRTNKTLNHVIQSLQLSEANKIITDRLRNYKYLINRKIHCTKQFGTNHIERNNLTLRTHLKRLNRKTICYSKSKLVLNSILTIYFWG